MNYYTAGISGLSAAVGWAPVLRTGGVRRVKIRRASSAPKSAKKEERRVEDKAYLPEVRAAGKIRRGDRGAAKKHPRNASSAGQAQHAYRDLFTSRRLSRMRPYVYTYSRGQLGSARSAGAVGISIFGSARTAGRVREGGARARARPPGGGISYSIVSRPCR